MTEGIINTEASLHALVSQTGNASLATWSDEKRKDFVGTFKERARCTRAILLLTAVAIREKAVHRRYISEKHLESIGSVAGIADLVDDPKNYAAQKIGGRPVDELSELASQRADAILHELPPIRTATKVIMPDVARKMDRRAVLLEKGKELLEKLREASKPVLLSELDQKMSIGDLRKVVQQRADERDGLAKELNRIGKEGCVLDDAINKALYDGLPGLSEAVITVVRQHAERATMLDQLTRRVEERVLFGDSKEAMDMLARFEKDEVEVSDGIKAEFAKAVEALKLAGLCGKRKK